MVLLNFMPTACMKHYINTESIETLTHASNETDSASIKVGEEVVYLTIFINCNKILLLNTQNFSHCRILNKLLITMKLAY
jgi:hypothetical protein